jgi:MobA-like NTP transferase domain
VTVAGTSPALVVLAGGLGSRFGGAKQLTPVGPGGELILDYAIRDARAAGFGPVVVVARSDIEDELAAHLAGSADVSIVCQDREPMAVAAAAAGRAKPLGTAHAAMTGMVAAGRVPVAIVNADDLYGAEPYRLLAEHRIGEGMIVTFPFANTVNGHGPVNRALCAVEGDLLVGIEEGRVEGDGWTGRSGRRVRLSPGSPVSMNCWGFPPGMVDDLVDACDRFIRSDRVAAGAEVLVVDVVRARLPFRARPTTSRCIGMTAPEDADLVRAALYSSGDAQ